MDNEERDNLIVVLNTKLDRLIKDFENHLTDHKKYSFYFFTLTIASIISLVTIVILNK